MLIKFDTNANFWDMYPQFKVGFAKLIKAGKKKSSKIMWGIALDIHPESVYAAMDPTERLELIQKDYMEDIEFDRTIYKDDIELFKKLCMTKKERYLHEWEKKLDERDNFISSLTYDEENAEFLDKLMGNTKRLQEQYDKAVEEYYKEKTQTSGKGGAEESLRERLKA